MNRHQIEFREAIGAHLNARERLGRALAELLPPTTTGYQWSKEEWGVNNAWEDSDRVVVVLVPPERAYELSSVTSELLDKIKEAIWCDRVQAIWKNERVMYRCSWPKDKPAAP